MILPEKAYNPLGYHIARNQAAVNIYDGLYKYRGGGSLGVWAAAGGKGKGGLQLKGKWASDRYWQGKRKAPRKKTLSGGLGARMKHGPSVWCGKETA